MKNYLKIIPIIAGLLLAIFGSVPEVSASNNQAMLTSYGYCDGPDNRLCTITAQGTMTYGTWVEEQPDHY